MSPPPRANKSVKALDRKPGTHRLNLQKKDSDTSTVTSKHLETTVATSAPAAIPATPATPKSPAPVTAKSAPANVGKPEKSTNRQNKSGNRSKPTAADAARKFSDHEVKRLLEVFKSYAVRDTSRRKYPTWRMDASTFKGIMFFTFGINHPAVLEGLFNAFNSGGRATLFDDDWLTGLSVFLRGDFEERVSFAWSVYAGVNQDYLTKVQMHEFLYQTFVGTRGADDELELQEATQDFVETVYRRLDVNQDNRVDFTDFEKAVLRQPLMLECLGRCFPSQRRVNVFRTTFADRTDVELL